jgi:hypothetical protein
MKWLGQSDKFLTSNPEAADSILRSPLQKKISLGLLDSNITCIHQDQENLFVATYYHKVLKIAIHCPDMVNACKEIGYGTPSSQSITILSLF